MPNFNGIVITNSGKTLLSKAQEGKELRFTKMQLGSANDITNPSEKTTVTTPFLTTEIRNVKLTTDGSVRISTFISNENLTQSYVWREIGLFALDPDTQEEILYAYKCAGENGETIPAGGGSDVIEKIFDIVLKVQNATNISAIIDDSTVFISRQEIVQELDNCAEEQYKVPSAQLFFKEIKNNRNISLLGAISGDSEFDEENNKIIINTNFNNIAIVEDTFTISAETAKADTYIAYPSGFNSRNCIILSYIYNISTSDSYSANTYINEISSKQVNVKITLNTSGINFSINVPEPGHVRYLKFKIALLKYKD